jgi:hypothetical protein
MSSRGEMFKDFKSNAWAGFGLGAGMSMWQLALNLALLFWVLFWVGLGYLQANSNNKEGTKLLEETKGSQYLGIVMIFIGLLPMLIFMGPYLLAGFVGEELF